MIRRPPRSTLFPTRRSSDLGRRPPDGADAVRRSATARLPAARRAQRRGGGGGGGQGAVDSRPHGHPHADRKSTRLNSSHVEISYAVFCLKKKRFAIRHI